MEPADSRLDRLYLMVAGLVGGTRRDEGGFLGNGAKLDGEWIVVGGGSRAADARRVCGDRCVYYRRYGGVCFYRSARPEQIRMDTSSRSGSGVKGGEVDIQQ